MLKHIYFEFDQTIRPAAMTSHIKINVMKFQTSCCYITDLSLLKNCISVYTGDLLLFLSHVHCWAPTVKLDFQVGGDAAGESQGTAERKLGLQVKQLLASDTHYSIPRLFRTRESSQTFRIKRKIVLILGSLKVTVIVSKQRCALITWRRDETANPRAAALIRRR